MIPFTIPAAVDVGWPPQSIALAVMSVVIAVVGTGLAAYFRSQGGSPASAVMTLLLVGMASLVPISIAAAGQGQAQRDMVAASDAAFRKTLEQTYGATTESTLHEAISAARSDGTIVLTRAGITEPVKPKLSGGSLVLFTLDGTEYPAKQRSVRRRRLAWPGQGGEAGALLRTHEPHDDTCPHTAGSGHA